MVLNFIVHTSHSLTQSLISHTPLYPFSTLCNCACKRERERERDPTEMWTLPKRCVWQFLDVCLIALSVLVVYLGVRVATHSQNFIVWFYKSTPHWMRWLLDMIYLRSSWLQRIFSYRLKIKETVEACDDISGQSVAGDLARSVGLSFETHRVRTKDGCNLILHRCFLPPHRKNRDINRGRGVRTAEAQCPVLLGHGLMQVCHIHHSIHELYILSAHYYTDTSFASTVFNVVEFGVFSLWW